MGGGGQIKYIGIKNDDEMVSVGNDIGYDVGHGQIAGNPSDNLSNDCLLSSSPSPPLPLIMANILFRYFHFCRQNTPLSGALAN